MNVTMILSVVSGLLQAIATATRNPAIGFDAGQIGGLLDLISRLILRGTEALSELEALTVEVNGMIAANRKPTAAEMRSWRDRSDAAHAGLQALKGAGGVPEENFPEEGEPKA